MHNHGCYICGKCKAKLWLGEKVEKRSMKNCPSTWQGKEDYWTVSKLYITGREMDKLFNDDR